MSATLAPSPRLATTSLPQPARRLSPQGVIGPGAANFFLAEIGLLAWLPVTSIFYAVAAVSLLAAASVFVIRADEVDEELACAGHRKDQACEGFLTLLRDRRVAILFAAVSALVFVLFMPETRIPSTFNREP